MATNSAILALAHEWQEQRNARLNLQKKVDAMEEDEKKQKAKLIDTIKKTKAQAVGDKANVFQVVTKDEPAVEDWNKLQAHILRTGEFDLLYRRVNPAGVKERWEEGKKVPGVTKFPVETLSVTKAKGA